MNSVLTLWFQPWDRKCMLFKVTKFVVIYYHQRQECLRATVTKEFQRPNKIKSWKAVSQWWNLPSKREWSRTASAANTDFPQPAIPYMVTHPGSPFSFQSFCWIAFTSFFLVTKTTGLCGTPPSHSTVLTESRNKYGWTKLQNLWVILLENQGKWGWCLASKFPRQNIKILFKKN